jgi:hypothetical protein
VKGANAPGGPGRFASRWDAGVPCRRGDRRQTGLARQGDGIGRVRRGPAVVPLTDQSRVVPERGRSGPRVLRPRRHPPAADAQVSQARQHLLGRLGEARPHAAGAEYLVGGRVFGGQGAAEAPGFAANRLEVSLGPRPRTEGCSPGEASPPDNPTRPRSHTANPTALMTCAQQTLSGPFPGSGGAEWGASSLCRPVAQRRAGPLLWW